MKFTRNRRDEVKNPDTLEQLPNHDEERLGKLFDQLDKDRNGRINVADIMAVFQHIPEQHVKESLEKADVLKSGDVDFVEFVQYIVEHEKNLAVIFSKLDQNRDGMLDTAEIKNSFQKLGLELDQPEADRLLKRMDANGSLTITFDEFRDYFLWYPSAKVQDLFGYWRHSTVSDAALSAFYYTFPLQRKPNDVFQKEMVSGMWWRHLVAGGVAGCVSRTATAPLDRIKTFYQVFGKKGECETLAKCFQSMIKEGGYMSLWRGNGMNVLKIAPESAIKFMTYEQIKKIMKGDSERELEIWERIVAGAGAGAFSQSAIYPMEVIKTRLTLRNTGQFDGIFHAARKIYRTEGFRAFYRGYAPNLMGILPYAGIDLAVYETLKRWYIAKHPPKSGTGQKPPALVVLGCGMVSSICGQVSSYPLALVKTILQASVDPITGAGSSGTVSVLRNIVMQDGFTGLYRGMGPNFLKAVPAVSISYVVYEHVREALGGYMT